MPRQRRRRPWLRRRGEAHAASDARVGRDAGLFERTGNADHASRLVQDPGHVIVPLPPPVAESASSMAPEPFLAMASEVIGEAEESQCGFAFNRSRSSGPIGEVSQFRC